MIGIIPAVCKDKKHVEAYTFESNKQTIDVREQYKVNFDGFEIGGSMNQQTIVAYAENEGLVAKLNDITMYQKCYFVIDISYYRGQLNKIVLLDVVTEDEKETLNSIFNKYLKV